MYILSNNWLKYLPFFLSSFFCCTSFFPFFASVPLSELLEPDLVFFSFSFIAGSLSCTSDDLLTFSLSVSVSVAVSVAVSVSLSELELLEDFLTGDFVLTTASIG